jgi:hypothetical protein
MSFRVCIPSKGRAGLMTSHKIFKSAYIYVPESEVSMYSMYDKVVGVPSGIKGITATRNWILKNTEEDVFFIDDDLMYGGYILRSDEKYKVIKVKDEEVYLGEIKKLFEVCKQMGSKICGFFSVGNNLTNYSYSPFLFNGVCLGSCMGMVNDGSYYFDESFKVKEDYELSLRHIKDRGLSVRSNILFLQHEHTQLSGGCRDSSRIEKEKEAVKRLIKMYPGCVKEAKHRGTSFSIQLNL